MSRWKTQSVTLQTGNVWMKDCVLLSGIYKNIFDVINIVIKCIVFNTECCVIFILCIKRIKILSLNIS